MAHAQKRDFVFRRKGRVHLNRRWRQFSRLLAAEVCASAVVMLDTPCSEVVWRVLATHPIRQFPLHFPTRASPCGITFQLDSNRKLIWKKCHTKSPQILGPTTQNLVHPNCQLMAHCVHEMCSCHIHHSTYDLCTHPAFWQTHVWHFVCTIIVFCK
jgi:hypothetical protein